MSVSPATVAAPAAPDPPILRYRAGDAFFSSPYGSLLGQGTVAETSTDGGDAADWSSAADALLRDARPETGQAPIVVGALPFVAGAPARLRVPRVVVRGRSPRRIATLPAPATGTGWTVRRRPSPEQFEAVVADALAEIRAGRLDKVVLARSLELTGPSDVAIPELLRRLAERNACGHVFAVDVGAADAPRTLVGASPELLVSRRARRAVSNPLAGSRPRNPDPVLDRDAATALVHSDKDRREHALVVDDVAARLRRLCSRIEVPSEPVLVRTPAMWHLSTRITGVLRDPDTTSLQLAESLHPTPAIGGMPTGPAVDFIRSREGFDRAYYTGLVGWCDGSGDGEWAIVLRCAEVHGRDLRLFAGGGVVEGSLPEAELAETSAKFATFLTALGLAVRP